MTFGALAAGDVFRCESEPYATYMKLTTGVWGTSNAVDLESGDTAVCGDQMPVTPLPHAKLVL